MTAIMTAIDSCGYCPILARLTLDRRNIRDLRSILPRLQRGSRVFESRYAHRILGHMTAIMTAMLT